MIKEYYAATLPDYYQAISKICTEQSIQKNRKHLWFRGHSFSYYYLLPTLFRERQYRSNDSLTYSQADLREDYRYQHIKSRAFHSVKTNPVYKSEWQEVGQHHFGSTRLMDWSESARTALTFALEAYVNTKSRKDLEYIRKNSTPCVWVLNPYKLNERVYDYFGKEFEGVIGNKLDKAFQELNGYSNLCKEIKDNKEIYFDQGKGDWEISGILSLCVLEDYRRNLGSQLVTRVKNFEFNPFYYMALRMYSDGVPFPIDTLTDKVLPPLAVLHPYHSERIRTQRGAFTMFPNYLLRNEAYELFRRRKIDMREMEKQPYIEDCLSVIYILDAYNVAGALMDSGERRSEIYPDIDTYVDIIETSQYYC